MKKINKAAIIFSLILIASLGLAGRAKAGVINTLNISIQNPPTPPPKPEPPLPPGIPTSEPRATSTPVPTPGSTNNNQGGSSSGGGDGLGCATHDCSVHPAPQGQVLGASAMAGTGSFEEIFYQAIMGLGASITAFGIKNFKKGHKVA